MNAKILEIFSSIQGEGPYAGIRQIFVRFFECNMHCVWCDTPHSIGDTSRRYQEYSLEQLLREIDRHDRHCSSVSLTGGEPLLQKDFIKILAPELRRRNKTIYLETNGVLPSELQAVIDDVDIVAMDIKLPSSTKCRAFWKEHDKFIRVALRKNFFIKTVVSGDTDEADIEKAVQLVSRIDPKIMFIIQPNTFELSNGVMKKCAAFHELALGSLPNARVMPQMHKFMKIR
jgi:organic radical activating enzyme